jgi:hypothetical protein
MTNILSSDTDHMPMPAYSEDLHPSQIRIRKTRKIPNLNQLSTTIANSADERIGTDGRKTSLITRSVPKRLLQIDEIEKD